MVVGNISAIGQRSVKRMLAFSSIAHAGFMLLGVIVIDSIGAKSLLFYGITYLFMTLVAFHIVSIVSDKYGNDHFDRFNGLISKYPIVVIIMCITMFSLAGLPPFSGFVAKFNVIAAVIAKKYYTLAFWAVLNSVISIYYYLKIVRSMIFRKAESDERIEGFGVIGHLIAAGLCVPVLVLGIFWNSMIELAGKSLLFIQ